MLQASTENVDVFIFMIVSLRFTADDDNDTPGMCIRVWEH